MLNIKHANLSDKTQSKTVIYRAVNWQDYCSLVITIWTLFGFQKIVLNTYGDYLHLIEIVVLLIDLINLLLFPGRNWMKLINNK